MQDRTVEITVSRADVRFANREERDAARRVLADLIVLVMSHGLKVNQIVQPNGDVLVQITGCPYAHDHVAAELSKLVANEGVRYVQASPSEEARGNPVALPGRTG